MPAKTQRVKDKPAAGKARVKKKAKKAKSCPDYINPSLASLIRPVAALLADPANVRLHDDANLSAIRGSLAAFRQQKPVVVRDGIVIAGNGTLAAARALHWDKIAVVEFDGDATQATAYGIADNRTAELAEWDDAELAKLLDSFDDDLRDAAGFSEQDVEDLLASLDPSPGLADPDAVPEPPEDPITQRGDLWTLGEHRLLCGDCMERSAYGRLLGDDPPDLLLTDPPYGVAYQDAGKSRIQGDLTQAAFPIALACVVEVLSDNARLYVFCATDQIAMADRVFSHNLGMRPRLVVWCKESFILRHNGYHSQYEMVCYGWKGSGGGSDFWYGDRKQSDVWNVPRDGDRVHPTQKPVAVCAIPITNSSASGDLVLEPFAGSGTTIIACEQLNRRCRAIEIEPRYVDVCVKRWESFTGRTATREAQ